MLQKNILFLSIWGFAFFANLFFYNTASAKVILNEIMYDLLGEDPGREWIEIYNEGGTSVNLPDWKLFEAETNHGLTLSQGNATLAAKNYAIIADDANKFKLDWPNFSGTIWSSSFSLNNTGETLALKNGDLEIDKYTYQSSLGGAGDGNSLQKISGSWSGVTPTPGKENKTPPAQNTSVSNASTSSNNGPTSPTSSSSVGSGPTLSPTQNNTSEAKPKVPETPRIRAEIISPKFLFKGLSLTFELKVTGYSNEKLLDGKYYWNFGNGDSKEIINKEKVEYVYDYPGEYLVSVEYSSNYYKREPDAVDTIIVKVNSPNLSILSIEPDGSVTISNEGNESIDLSNWILKDEKNFFLFPKNTIIMAGRKITLSPKTTNFPAGLSKAEIALPSGLVIAVYPIIKNSLASGNNNEIIIEEKTNSVKNNKEEKLILAKVPPEKSFSKAKAELELKNLSANALMASEAVTQNYKNPENKINWATKVFLLFLGISTGAFYFIKRKMDPVGPSDGFKILEE
jgi:hypothetical protein